MTADVASRAGVELRRRPFWRLRVAHEARRYLISALSVFGLLATARFTFDPPRAAAPHVARSSAPTVDLTAQGFATEFARRYLSWNASEPLADSRSLEPFAGTQMEAAAGLVLPARGSEQVQWAEVVQAREPSAGVHVYTIAAATGGEQLTYLTVPVERTASGALALAAYPAFVGAPASAPAIAPSGSQPISDQALAVVVRRAIGNYLSDSPVELAADLAEGAQVSTPSPGLRLLSVQRLQWAPGGGAVSVVVQAEDRLGARHTLSYELDVTRAQDRWEISAIQTDPDG